MIKLAPEIETAHNRVAMALRQRLHDGRWSVGEMLPGRRDLAKEFGVSVATIERAILPLLSEGMLRSDGRRGTFVGRIAGERNAASVPAAKEAAYSAQTGTVGIVASFGYKLQPGVDQNGYWNRMLTDSMERQFSDANQTIVVINRVPIGGESPIPLADTFSAALEMALDGIVVICNDLEPDAVDEAVGRLAEYKLPAVFVASAEIGKPFPHVVEDGFRGGYLAAQHLLRTGHAQITVVCPFRAQWAEERLRGVRSAVAHRGLPESAVQVLRGEDNNWMFNGAQFPATQAALKMAVDAGWGFGGAIVAIHDIVAFGVIFEGIAAGLIPGRDYALIGFDDHPTARLIGLTSMRPPVEAIARESARLLLQAVSGNTASMVSRMQAEVVTRSSTTVVGGERLSRDDYGRIMSHEFGFEWNSSRRLGEPPTLK